MRLSGTFETLPLLIKAKKKKSLSVPDYIYRPPRHDATFISEFAELVSETETRFEKVTDNWRFYSLTESLNLTSCDWTYLLQRSYSWSSLSLGLKIPNVKCIDVCISDDQWHMFNMILPCVTCSAPPRTSYLSDSELLRKTCSSILNSIAPQEYCLTLFTGPPPGQIIDVNPKKC